MTCPLGDGKGGWGGDHMTTAAGCTAEIGCVSILHEDERTLVAYTVVSWVSAQMGA